MAYSTRALEEIKTRLPLSQVISDYVSWDRRKSRPAQGDYWACCPFHHEKTPSFHVSDNKGLYYCFGCQAKGDHFRFICEKKGGDFGEALRYLADRAGVVLPANKREGDSDDYNRLFSVMASATKLFNDWLFSLEGKKALGYLRDTRGLSDDLIKRFRLGYAPGNGWALLNALQNKGFEQNDVVAAGLALERDFGTDTGSLRDRFRDRVIFPITDRRHRVIAFGGRALNKNALAKYLNSPSTKLFAKKTTLYNLASACAEIKPQTTTQAPQAIRDDQIDHTLIIVEGYMDVIAMASYGLGNTVAPLGTALTMEQLNGVWHVCSCPVLCFDGDQAGIGAAYRTIERSLPQVSAQTTFKIALLPADCDPDDYIRRNGAQAMRRLLAGAVAIVDMIWEREWGRTSLETPEDRAGLEQRLAKLLAQIGDDSVRRHYRLIYKQRLQKAFAQGFSNRNQPTNKTPGATDSNKAIASYFSSRFSNSIKRSQVWGNANDNSSLEDILIGILLHYPTLIIEFAEEIASFELLNLELSALRTYLLEAAAFSGVGDDAMTTDDILELVAKQNPKGNQIIERLSLRLKSYPEWKTILSEDMPGVIKRWRYGASLYQRHQKLTLELHRVETLLAQNGREYEWSRLQAVRSELSAIEMERDRNGWLGNVNLEGEGITNH